MTRESLQARCVSAAEELARNAHALGVPCAHFYFRDGETVLMVSFAAVKVVPGTSAPDRLAIIGGCANGRSKESDTAPGTIRESA